MHADGFYATLLATVVFEPIIAFGDAIKGIAGADVLFDN
jgi:hypothetical protein